jgi:NADH-quinone oxidoreductase subunit J
MAVFLPAAAAAVISGLFVVFHRNPVVNAVALIVNLACIAVFFALLHAPFLAAVQVIVYAGAIMVLFLFVIMLLDLRAEMHRVRSGGFQRAMAVLGGGAFLLLLGTALRRSRIAPGGGAPAPGRVEELARLLFTDHLIPFELASVLLLVAMVGALVLARAFFEEERRG